MEGGRIYANGVDRISQLPEFLIHKVMSFLDPKTRIQTGILSKKWYYFWSTLPILHFDQIHFREALLYLNPELSAFVQELEPEILEIRDNFFKSIDNSMKRLRDNHLRFSSFYLFMAVDDSKLFSLLDRWMEAAAENRVEELVLKLETGQNLCYNLPKSVLSRQVPLKKVWLQGCMLAHPLPPVVHGPFAQQLLSLEKLTLRKVRLSEEMLQILLSHCPLIRELMFVQLIGVRKIHVPAGLTRLFTLTVDPYLNTNLDAAMMIIDVHAPNLREFVYGWEAIPSLRRCEINLSGDGRLGSETLQLAGAVHMFHDFVKGICGLEALRLNGCTRLERICIKNPVLKNFVATCCKQLMGAIVDAPKANPRASIYGNGHCKIPITLNDASCPCHWSMKIGLASVRYNDLDQSWFLELRENLSTPSHHIEVVEADIKVRTIELDLEQVAENLLPPPANVGHLKLLLVSRPDHDPVILDGLLWSCHPQFLSLVWGTPKPLTLFSIKLIVEKIMRREENMASNHPHQWLHSLKGIEFVGMKGFADGSTLQLSALSDESLGVLLLQAQEMSFKLEWY
ncbi:hypothetical protein Nepgr_017833 [Nepenthes gracilis]|uniref:F-box domain-containing protein n=1 Tax=Nepenthes gracilis TaxID=150966 RepID=A0AAD3ST14_NEPGR|nr:hypothetical protein Nepgr_017833 [Nepenthes gracilis]